MALSTVKQNSKITASTINGVINAVNSIQTATPNAYITATWKSGTSFYRKWSDGFIEQGGEVAGNVGTVTFAQAFSNTNYAIQAFTMATSKTEIQHSMLLKTDKKNTGITLYHGASGATANQYANYTHSWYACRILKYTIFTNKRRLAQNERIFHWSNF